MPKFTSLEVVGMCFMVVQIVTYVKQGIFMQIDIFNAIYHVVKHLWTFTAIFEKSRKGYSFVKDTVALERPVTVRTSELEAKR